MPESLSVAHVIRIAEAGERFTLNGRDVPLPDLVAIAAAASRSRSCVTFRGLDDRPLEDLMRITVASRGHVVFEADERPRPCEAAAPRGWFGLRARAASGVRSDGKARSAEMLRSDVPRARGVARPVPIAL